MKPKVISISPLLPSPNSESAGGRLVNAIASVISRDADFMLLVPQGGANKRVVESGIQFNFKSIDLQEKSAKRRFKRVTQYRITRFLNNKFTALTFESAWARETILNPEFLKEIQNADVIDLEWEEQGALIPRIRKIRPDIRIVCVLHDILSQKYERFAINSTNHVKKLYWRIAALRARSLERRIVAESDKVVVLSEKDRFLLPGNSSNIVIVRPEAMTFSESKFTRRPEPKTLLFVGFMARFENEEAVVWFAREILPIIRRAHPDVVVKVAGRGIRPDFQKIADVAGIQLLDFVEDLESLYSTSTCMIVPLRYGAGVKFKTVDAISNCIPLVTTSIGAEGIFENSDVMQTYDDSSSFAAEVIRKLDDPLNAIVEAESLRMFLLNASERSDQDAIIRETYLGGNLKTNIRLD